MPPLLIVIFAVAGWIALTLGLRWAGEWFFSRGPGGDPVTGLMVLATQVYCHLMHRTQYEGLKHVPQTNQPGGLIVVSNHGSPIDPVLIQSACGFVVRWMMAGDMMIPQLGWLWRHQRMIPVARDGRDLGPAREAIRHVQAGGVLGVFPEGALVRPRDQVRPFHPGIGFMIAKTHAPVLLLWLSGTPEATHLGSALLTRSHARVRFIDRLEFGDERDPAAITQTLRRLLAEATGWPLCDEPLAPTQVEVVDPFGAPRPAEPDAVS